MPRKTEDYIRLDAPGEAGKHEGHELRTRTFSKKDGIKALYCIQCKKHVIYLFNRNPPWNWTMSRAQAWIKRHKKASFAALSENGEPVFEHFNEKGELVETVGREQLIQEAEETDQTDSDKELLEDRVIFLFSDISDDAAERVCRRLLIYDKLDKEKPVKLFISSYGGSVYSSFAIIDMMEYIQAPVHTTGIGKIMSGGLLIFMAGDKRYISQTASVLSHRFRVMKVGTQAELKADQKEDELVHQHMVDHYKKFTNLKTDKEVLAKLLKETNVWLTPEETMEFGLADDYFDKDWTGEEEGDEEGGQTAITYTCQCIKCGYTMTSTKHCNTLKCPKCGGTMRRKSRPGPGQEAFLDEGYEHKLGGYGYISENSSASEYGSPKSEFGYYPSVERLSEIYFLLGRLEDEDHTKVLQKIKGILKHWTGQPYPVPEGYWLPDEVEDAAELEEMNNVLDQLISSDKSADYKDVLQEVKAILSRIVQGDFSYPRVYSSLEEVKNMSLNEGFINEPVSVDWIEEDASKPFRFRGKALKVDRINKNNRRYKKDITERALKETRRLGERGQVLTVMSGHPKKGDTDPSKVVGKVTFGDIDLDGWMPYEASLSDTSLGMDIQKLLKDKCIGDVSLRSKGRTATAKLDGQPIDDVVDLHYRGLDLVIEGSEEGAGVEDIFNSYWEGPELLEAIGGSRSLPLDPSGAWDGTAAERRMRTTAGGPDKDKMNWSRYQKGFVWYDATDKENFGSYKLPFADIVGGKLTAVWGGVNGAMGAVNGARTKLKLSPAERKSAYNFLVSYYKRFDKTPPDFKGELLGGETIMKDITLERLKEERADLVEKIRSEEKEKLNKNLEKTKNELKETKEELERTKEGSTGGSKEIEELKSQVKDLSEKIVILESEKKLRESKEVYIAKLKDSGLTEEMSEGLEQICLGKKDEEMDKLIEARIELIKKVTKSEVIGLSEKKEGKTKEEKIIEAKEVEDEVREAFGGKKKEEKKE